MCSLNICVLTFAFAICQQPVEIESVDPQQVATAEMALAEMGRLFVSGDNEKALAIGKPALNAARRIGDGQHLVVGQLCHAIGCVLGRTSDVDAAIPFLTESVAIHVQRLGRQHAQTAQSFQSLGCGYLNAGDLKTARKLSFQATVAFSISLGSNHPETEAAREQFNDLPFSAN